MASALNPLPTTTTLPGTPRTRTIMASALNPLPTITSLATTSPEMKITGYILKIRQQVTQSTTISSATPTIPRFSPTARAIPGTSPPHWAPTSSAVLTSVGTTGPTPQAPAGHRTTRISEWVSPNNTI